MLKKNRQLFEDLLFVSDLAVISLSWIFSYYLRFHSGIMPVSKGTPDLKVYLFFIIPIVAIWGISFKASGLYRSRRIVSRLYEFLDIAKASSLSIVILVAASSFFRHYELSRAVVAIFGFINIFALFLVRVVFRGGLGYVRRKGFNTRDAIIIGTSGAALKMAQCLVAHPEAGINVVGFLVDGKRRPPDAINGLDILGAYNEARRIIKDKDIDHVIVAMGIEEHRQFIDVLKDIGREMVDIKVVPDLYELMTLRGGVEDFEGIPIVTIQGSPLYGWNMVVKRAIDALFSAIGIIITMPLMLLIVILIKLTSEGPVFYRQERVGIGGDTFRILKFRTMDVDAEEKTGATWARKNDLRCTRFGGFLRRTSLDELPQLFNVFMGEMSLVGPRPERPVFIEEFKKNIPRYMLRHKMKAGITGWAQINGFRGSTDLGKRVEHDLYYIENWSLAFDIKILFMTIWRGFINKNAY